jgi:hypothetical protein
MVIGGILINAVMLAERIDGDVHVLSAGAPSWSNC